MQTYADQGAVINIVTSILSFSFHIKHVVTALHHFTTLVCRSYLRNIATIEGLIRMQIMLQTVSSAWLPLISLIVLMIAWYIPGFSFFFHPSFTLLAPAPKPLNCKSLAGNSMWSFLSFWLSTKVDGYQDGMPNLPASTTTSLGILVHSCLYYIGLIDTAQLVDSGNELMQKLAFTKHFWFPIASFHFFSEIMIEVYFGSCFWYIFCIYFISVLFQAGKSRYYAWYRAISNADVTWCCHALYLTPHFVNRIMLSVRRNFTNANYFQFYNWHTRFFALLQIN